MKATIAIFALCVACAGHARCQTNSNPKALVVTHRTPMTVVLPDPLTTTSGKKYTHIKLVKVCPSYITISYVNEDSAFDLENVRLEQLSTNLQVQFGYDPTNAMLYDAMEDKKAALLSNSSGMTPSERRWYNYNQVLLRRQDEADEAARQAAIAEKARQDALQEREVEAKERAARAAAEQAEKPPAQNNTIIIQQQQQNNYGN